MYLKDLSRKLDEFKTKINYIEILCKIDLSFDNDDTALAINEIIDIFVPINEKIQEANTFDSLRKAFFEASKDVSDVLVQMVEAFENKNLSKIHLEKLINVSKRYKEKLQEIIDNSVNDIVNVYYEIKMIGKKEFNILYFTNQKRDYTNSVKQVFLYELENYKIDSIVIDSIKSEKIRNILIKENYDLKMIFMKNEIKVNISNLKNKEISNEEYSILHLNLNRIDLAYYLGSKKSNISIISNNCWGGYFYKKCGLEYSSPLVWTFVPVNDFIKLINNLSHYFNCKLEFIKEENLEYPVAFLDNIKIYFPHYKTEEEAESKWNKRLNRFSYDNILLQANIENYDDAIKFENVRIKNKIAFTPQNYNLTSCVYLDKWNNEQRDYEKYKNFSQYCHLRSWEYIDIPKLLLNEY
jgi:uncharacterized protein (DUF1919 family)